MYGLIRNGLAQCDYGFGPQLYNYNLPCREVSTYQAWQPAERKEHVGYKQNTQTKAESLNILGSNGVMIQFMVMKLLVAYLIIAEIIRE